MDLITKQAQDLSQLSREDLCQLIGALVENQRSLAEGQQQMAEEMRLMRRSIQQLTKVTPAQATQLNRLMRETAETLVQRYRLQDIPNAVTLLSNCIRRDVRFRAGIQSMRDLPRCEFDAYVNYISLWDNYKAAKSIRSRQERKG